MNIKPIKNKKDYEIALKRLEKIFDSKPGSKEGDELEILSILIEKYEEEHFTIDAPDPIEAIKFRMEQLGYKTKDLEKIIGSKSHLNEVLNRKRKLSLNMIRKLHESLHISASVLVREY